MDFRAKIKVIYHNANKTSYSSLFEHHQAGIFNIIFKEKYADMTSSQT
jgi:hypothetical protein